MSIFHVRCAFICSIRSKNFWIVTGKGLFKDPVVGTRRGMVWTKYVWMASRWWVFYVRDYPRCMWVSSINICIVGIIRELILSQYQPSLWWLPPRYAWLCKENRILKTDGPRREEFLLLVEFVQGVVVGRGTIQSWWVGTLCKPSKPMKGKIRHGIWMANNLNRVVMILDQFWSYDYLRASCI